MTGSYDPHKKLKEYNDNGSHAKYWGGPQSVKCGAANFPDIKARVLAEGHTIGNHTYGHENLGYVSAALARAQIKDCATALGGGVKYMRPPYGSPFFPGTKPLVTDWATVKGMINELGMKPLMWDIDPNDWKHVESADAAVAEFETQFKKAFPTAAKEGDPQLPDPLPGRIILMHDVHPQSVEALDKVIQMVKDWGVEPVTVDDVKAKGKGSYAFK